jgi:hypothetical protein
MSAGLTNRDIQIGVVMAWHKKTKVVPAITRENCGIIYPMEKHVMAPYADKPIPGYVRFQSDTGEVLYFNVATKDFHAIVSTDDGLPIGDAIGKGYMLYDNARMFDMVSDAIAGTAHKVVSVGTVNSRAKCFCSVQLDGGKTVQAAGRETETVLNILWGHGGKFGILARSGMTVVVCQNTFAMALARRGEFELRLKHTGNSEAKLENMSKAIDAHYGVVAEFQKAMDSFADTSCPKDRAERIFAGFLVREETPEKVSTRTQNQMERLNTLFVKGKGNRGDNMADVFNAVTDYYTHESSGGDNVWRQVESGEYGQGFDRKTEMFRLISGETVPKLGTMADVTRRGEKVLKLV